MDYLLLHVKAQGHKSSERIEVLADNVYIRKAPDYSRNKNFQMYRKYTKIKNNLFERIGLIIPDNIYESIEHYKIPIMLRRSIENQK